MWRELLQPAKSVAKAPATSTDGRTIYAVGDIHGRLDLLDPLLAQIRGDARLRGGDTKPVLVFVGDYVDRGAASRGVVDRLVALSQGDVFEVRALKGNHDAALLAFLDDAAFGPTWCEHGGRQTLRSYGVSPPTSRFDTDGWLATRDAFDSAVPDEHRQFLAGLELIVTYGDYAFVHAGLRPGVALSDQREEDLLWIRGDFL